MSQASIHRRSFLSRSAGAGAGLALASFPGIVSARNVNNRLNLGIVGPGGRGTGRLKRFFQMNRRFNARLVAVCDLWNYRRENAVELAKAEQGHAPKAYRHHEEILADADVDALIIATPDHAHAQILKLAADAGKDAYCEKPMANVLEEANAALDAVRKSDTIVQIGTQRRANPKYRQASRMIAEGFIGDVVKVDFHWSKYSPYRWARKEKDILMAKESDLDWNTWLMGRPHRPFDPRIFRCFRLFKDFSSGIIDQWMSHGIDLAHMLSGVTYPSSVVAHGGIYQWKDYRENPDTQEITLEYRKGDRKFLAVYSTNWINGYGSGTRVHGTLGSFKGEAISHRDNDWYFSGKGVKADGRVADKVPVEGDPGETDHMANWLDAVRSRDSKRLYAPVEAGYGHSIACIMATDSYWSGKRMVFDPEKRTIQAG